MTKHPLSEFNLTSYSTCIGICEGKRVRHQCLYKMALFTQFDPNCTWDKIARARWSVRNCFELIHPSKFHPFIRSRLILRSYLQCGKIIFIKNWSISWTSKLYSASNLNRFLTYLVHVLIFILENLKNMCSTWKWCI